MVITNEPCLDGLVDSTTWRQICSHTPRAAVITAFPVNKKEKTDVGSVCQCRSNKSKLNAPMKDKTIHKLVINLLRVLNVKVWSLWIEMFFCFFYKINHKKQKSKHSQDDLWVVFFLVEMSGFPHFPDLCSNKSILMCNSNARDCFGSLYPYVERAVNRN